MFELPEIITLSRQIDETLKGKVIRVPLEPDYMLVLGECGCFSWARQNLSRVV